MSRRFVLTLLFLAMGAGCATPHEPAPARYDWVDAETALADLRARARAVETVSAECSITLIRSDGESVQFDGAMVTRNPGWVRLRAWKFNRAVFDLTLQPAGLWVMTMDDPKRRDDLLPASVNAADFVRQWSYFNGALFDLADANSSTVAGDTLIVRTPDGATPEGRQLECEVDRRTLTPRRYHFADEGRPFDLTLDRYRDINGVPWPSRLVARSEMGTVVIEQRNVEINGELAPNAFVPPRRAEKRP